MSEREDAGEKNTEDHQQQQQQHHQAQPPQPQSQYQTELSDDNPIENDVEHTTTTDDAPADGQKSASADSGAEEVGSPEQLAIHGTRIS